MKVKNEPKPIIRYGLEFLENMAKDNRLNEFTNLEDLVNELFIDGHNTGSIIFNSFQANKDIQESYTLEELYKKESFLGYDFKNMGIETIHAILAEQEFKNYVYNVSSRFSENYINTIFQITIDNKLDNILNNKEFMLEVVKQNGGALEYASKELRNDKEVVLEAVKENGFALRYASEELQDEIKVELGKKPDIKAKIESYKKETNITKDENKLLNKNKGIEI